MPGKHVFTYISPSPEDTRRTAAKLARELAPGTVIALDGGLGSGKTCFVQGLARALVCDADAVSSPTFTYVNEYACADGGVLAHMDMYRINASGDIVNFDPQEYFSESRLCAVEWAERIQDILPDDRLCIDFEVSGENERRLLMSTDDAELIGRIQTALAGQ